MGKDSIGKDWYNANNFGIKTKINSFCILIINLLVNTKIVYIFSFALLNVLYYTIFST